MNAEAWLILIGAILGSSVVTALINGLWQRGKAKADTLSVLNQTALDLVTPLRDQLKAQQVELEGHRQRVGMLERRERESAELMAAHYAWDVLAVAALSSHQHDLPEMPPLFPASRRERTRADDFPPPKAENP